LFQTWREEEINYNKKGNENIRKAIAKIKRIVNSIFKVEEANAKLWI